MEKVVHAEITRLKELIKSGELEYDHDYRIFTTDDDFIFMARGDLIPFTYHKGEGLEKYLKEV